MIRLNEEELAAWDQFAAAALGMALERYPSRPELAAREAAATADELVEERRQRAREI